MRESSDTKMALCILLLRRVGARLHRKEIVIGIATPGPVHG